MLIVLRQSQGVSVDLFLTAVLQDFGHDYAVLSGRQQALRSPSLPGSLF